MFQVPCTRGELKKLLVSRKCSFYRAAAMQARYCDEHLSVCLSVRLSVKRVHCDKTKAPSEKSSIVTNELSNEPKMNSVRVSDV